MNSCRSSSIVAVSLAVAVLFSVFHFSTFAANGSVYVFDSFGPGMTYSNQWWIVAGAPSPYGYQGHAEYFVPSVSGYLSQIQLATIIRSGVSESDFSIAQDNGSGVPGTILESFNNVTDANGILTINSIATPLLQAGQTYWLCDSPAASSTIVGWYYNNQDLINHDAGGNAPGTWFKSPSGTTDSVFSISVVPVPEPSTAGLFLLGAGLWTARRRRFSVNL